MKAVVKWIDGRAFEGSADSGHKIVMDGPPDSGGQNRGARPMETMLLGMGGCTAFDVVDILEKGREAVDDCVLEITAERAEEIPQVFTKIHVKYLITGKGLNPEKVDRAVHLSAEKYCSASIMLGATADITHEVEIIESGS
ncbi:MAG: OsmC family protein [Proteobacteria bacterium]|nr:OsmC family protein [Pseudomonadota bacterium]